jgi:hypothetical protein
MIALAYGAIEVGSIVSAYLTITHTTREGANLTSRGTQPNPALDSIVAASSNTFRTSNQSHWRIIYSKVVQDTSVPCPNAPTTPCVYRIDSQIVRGTLAKSSKLSATGAVNEVVNIPGIDGVKAGQTFHSVEVYFDYAPYISTFIGHSLSTDFYERSIFTNTSGQLN